MTMEHPDSDQRKRRNKALIVTIAFHAVVLVLFLFFGLKQPVPLPTDAGASVEFGWDEQSGADISVPAAPSKPIPQPTPPAETTPTREEVVDEVAKEDASDISVPEPKKPEPKKEEKPKKPAEEKPSVKEEKPVEKQPEPTLDNRLSEALGSLGQGSGEGQGDEQGPGKKGSPLGKDGKGVLGGGSGSWELSGRSMLPGFGTKITDTKEEGIVTLNIWVDRQGKVTKVQPNLMESNTTSQYLINLAKNDVLNNFRFNGDPGAAIEQKGKVRYVFQLE